MAKKKQVEPTERESSELTKAVGLSDGDVQRILSTDYSEYFRHGQEIAQRMRGKVAQ